MSNPNPHRQHFNEWCPEPQISRGWLIVYLTAILACYMIVSHLDYQDATEQARANCEVRSTVYTKFTYQPESGICKKERKNGTTKKN